MNRHDWPGNVRELRNYVERSVVLQTTALTPSPKRASASSGTPEIPDFSIPFRVAKESAIDTFERHYLATLLDAAQGNMSKAARMVGMDRMYLHRLVQKHGLRGTGGG
jgi:DNA-binding NtrC family response regulator